MLPPLIHVCPNLLLHLVEKNYVGDVGELDVCSSS